MLSHPFLSERENDLHFSEDPATAAANEDDSYSNGASSNEAVKSIATFTAPRPLPMKKRTVPTVSNYHAERSRAGNIPVRDAYKTACHDSDEEWSTLPQRKKAKAKSSNPLATYYTMPRTHAFMLSKCFQHQQTSRLYAEVQDSGPLPCETGGRSPKAACIWTDIWSTRSCLSSSASSRFVSATCGLTVYS